MKREIIFRAKRTDNREWAEGYYLVQNGRGVDGNSDTEIHQIMESGSTQIVRPETVGQYTGIKDINGVKIFEGDVIRHYSKFYEPDVKYNPELFESEEIGTIQFKSGCFGFVSLNGKSEMYGVLEDNEENSLGFEDYWFEVIGNIHDNPELLER
jgi:uncharacterized phage protein (TIGR01671 family)